MKRKDLIKHLEKEGNPQLHKTSSIPRHTEIGKFLAKKICKDLGIKEK